MLTGIMASPATLALAGMFFAWLVMLHIPRVLGAPHNGNEWSITPSRPVRLGQHSEFERRLQ